MHHKTTIQLTPPNQDLTPSQHTLLLLLINGPPTPSYTLSSTISIPQLFAAGDVSQRVYGWRGSMGGGYVDGFLKDFSQGVVVPFRTNYR